MGLIRRRLRALPRKPKFYREFTLAGEHISERVASPDRLLDIALAYLRPGASVAK